MFTSRTLKQEDEEQHHNLNAKMADVAVTMKTVTDQARGKDKFTGMNQRGTAPSGQGLQAGQVIPWYILDPTGQLIREQRSDASTRLQLDPTAGKGVCGFSAQQYARCMVRMPTVYPWWDAVTAIALIFTALVTPYEVGFLPPATSPWNALWLINRFIDLIFIFDMFIQCCTMRKVSVEKAMDSDDSRIEWETDIRVIARQYVCSFWFLLDVASIAPSGLEIAPMLMGTAGDGSSSGGLRSLRTMRSLRLIKLLRLAKSSRVSARAMEFNSLSSTSQTALALTLQSLLFTHWFACILMISTTFEAPRNSWLFTHGFCTPNTTIGEAYEGSTVEVDAEGAFSCVSNLFMYLNVWQWAMGLVYHNSLPMFPSEGPFEPTYVESNVYLAKFTHGENILIMILKLIGIGFWSLTIAKLIHAITVLGNPAAINFQKDIDAVNRFCSYNRLPTRLARELRRYMYNTSEVHAQKARADIYKKLSPLLVTKVTRLLNRPIFASSFLRRGLADFPPADGDRFVSAIITGSTTAVFSPGDRPRGARLYLVTEGVAVHKLFHLLSVGDCWGDEDVLLGDVPRKARETKAMTYLRVIMMERGAFRSLEDDFPEPYAKLRMHAIWKRSRRILLQTVLPKAKAYMRDHGEPIPLNHLLVGFGGVDGSFRGGADGSCRSSCRSSCADGGCRSSYSGGGSSAITVLGSLEAPSSAKGTCKGTPVSAEDGTASGGTAVRQLSGLVAESRRGLEQRHDQLAADVAAVAQVARASHDTVLALSRRMEEMSQALMHAGMAARAAPAPTTTDSRLPPLTHQPPQSNLLSPHPGQHPRAIPSSAPAAGRGAAVLREGSATWGSPRSAMLIRPTGNHGRCWV